MAKTALIPLALAATLCAPLAGKATDNPETAAAWSPAGAADLVELVECHAATAARLRESAERLSLDPRWTFAHQSLAAEQDRHDTVGVVVRRLVDRESYRGILRAYFPDGLAPADSAERVDRWTRCIRLYNRIDNGLRRVRAERARRG